MRNPDTSLKYLFTLPLLLLNPFSGFAQTVFVVDKFTNVPIEAVTVFTEDQKHYEVTDSAGRVNISHFPEGAGLLLQHPAYRGAKVTRAELKKNNYTIFLSEKIISMGEVVVSANKWEQDAREIPHEIVAITPENIAFKNPQTAADMLEGTGKVFVQKSQLGGGSPMIRGFGANSVLIVVDGVRMNNAIFRSGNLQNIINIDPNVLGGAEVIMGPGSVIYGSDALGGVMDFHTKNIDLTDQEKPFSLNAFSRFSSANLEKTGHLHWMLKGEKLGWFGGFSYSDFADLRAGANRPDGHPDFGKRSFYVERIQGIDSVIPNKNPDKMVPSGYRPISGIQKLKWQVTPNLDLGYTFKYSTTGNIPRFDRLIEVENGIPVQAEWYYGPQEWMMNALKINSRSTQFWDEASLTLARQHFEESRHTRGFNATRLRSRMEKVNVHSLNFDANRTTRSAVHFFYGAEYVVNNVASSAREKDIETGEIYALSTRYPNGGAETHSLAGYLSWKYSPIPSVMINGGARYSYYRLSALIQDENFPFDKINTESNSLNGNLGSVITIGRNFHINLLGSTGFRAPNLDDVAKVFDSEPGNVVVPNPDLKPEYSYNLEGGFDWQLSPDISVKAQGFYSWLRNAMVRADFTFDGQDSILYDGALSRVQALVNTGRAVVYGLDATVKWEIAQNWAIESYLNYTWGQDLKTGESIRHITPLFGGTSLHFRKGKFRSELFSRYNGRIRYDDLPVSEQNKTHIYATEGSLAWATLNLRMSFDWSRVFTINAAVENIFDKHYLTYSSGIPAPGINFILSLHAHF